MRRTHTHRRARTFAHIHVHMHVAVDHGTAGTALKCRQIKGVHCSCPTGCDSVSAPSPPYDIQMVDDMVPGVLVHTQIVSALPACACTGTCVRDWSHFMQRAGKPYPTADCRHFACSVRRIPHSLASVSPTMLRLLRSVAYNFSHTGKSSCRSKQIMPRIRISAASSELRAYSSSRVHALEASTHI